MLDFRIDTFLEVCKYMNITKAAKSLNITQPAATQHIKFLENSYNIKLFNYKSKKLSLTKEGEIFLNYITTLKHDDLKLRSEICLIDNKNLQLNFGTTLTIGEYLIPDKIIKYLTDNYNVNMKILVANTNELLNYINMGNIDFAIIEGNFPKNEFDYIKVSAENYIGVCGKNCELYSKNLSLEDLLNQRLIIREKGSGSRELIEKYLENRSISINDFSNTIEINNINTIKELVKSNIGITFLYEAAVKKELKNNELVKLHIKDFKIEHDFNLIWRKNSKYKNYYYKIFEDFIK